MIKTRMRLLAGGASALIMVLALLGCSKDEKQAPPPPGVVVAPVVTESVALRTRFVGQTIADKSVDLVARVEGFLEKRGFDEGADVKKGTVLYTIEKAQYQAQVDSAQASLQKAQAELKNADIEYNRLKGLRERNAVSQRDYDKASCEKTTAEANVLAAKAELDLAKLNLSYTDIKAPFDGRMGATNYYAGNLVSPRSGTLAHIVALEPIKVEFNVSESIMIGYLLDGKVSPDREPTAVLKLLLANGEMYKHAGKICFLNNTVNSMTGTIKVRGEFPNPDKALLPGLYVRVIVESKDKKDKLMIPSCAVQEDQGGKYVMVVGKDNKVSRRVIETGDHYEVNIIVEKGLNNGELVITDGLQKVRNGIVVKPVRDQTDQSTLPQQQ